MIQTRVDNQRVLDALNGLMKHAQDVRPALQDMGEYFIESTKRRFATKTAPDGTRWEDNSSVTEERKGKNDPLIGESRRLSNEIHYRATATTLEWGSSLVYAGMQQFGGLKAAYPHLWGNIPKREFLGMSSEDEAMALEILQEHLAEPLEGGGP
ncbi:phage virion morphogenesis protein [Pseudomonas sp. MDMC216]|nr:MULTISPECIES: phage virion morphogenesis protein [unclassified Pseudomonas]MDI5994416.1 phage virion morphogenesis protein [Pseudomonas sp. MDMC216]MDI6008439.1 phage virion morphogenesis protein [Pseudomonas sp. MDMC17]RAR40255.1 phage virion morphogenesis protein [Pseudomonas sp. MDMC224]